MSEQSENEQPADLGEGGLRALKAEREARKAAEKELGELRARVAEMETEGARRDVAAAKGLSEAQARFLTGSTREELEAAADALTEAFKPPASGPPSRRPTELKGGADPDADHGPNAATIAKQIMSR